MYSNFIKIFFCALIFVSCQTENKNKSSTLVNLTQYVDPQIGSVHGRWFFYTPVAHPFGMAKLAPHTNAYGSEGGWGPVGYDDRHTPIEGFGFFHEFQIGGLIQMPTSGPLKTIPGTLENPDLGYRSRFSKRTEQAAAGYYRVVLDDYNIMTELTSTQRVGYTRYTFPQTEEAHLLFDIGHKQGESSTIIEAYAELINDTTVIGSIETYPEYAKFCDPGKHVRMYFYTTMNRAPKAYGSFIDNVQTPNERITRGTNNGLYMTFNLTNNETLLTKTGLSFTSIDNAKRNLEAEATGKTFDQVRQEADGAWNKMLNHIVVEGENENDKKKFYTGLYHALLGRGISNDVNGDYPLVDGKIGKTPLDDNGNPTYRHFNTDGMWGGYWNLSQLWALAYPKVFRDYMQSNVDFYKDRDWLHDGAATGVFTNGVQTNFQGLLLASAYHCGIRDFDIDIGYEAALKNELNGSGRNLGNGKYDLHYFINDGYVPYKDTTISNGWVFNFGASHTLEYCFSSYAVGEWANAKGDLENAQKLFDQAGYYKNLLDPETKMIRPKYENGQFHTPFDPLKAWDGFQEGNAAQFTWFIPHDIKGLVDFIGLDTFNTRLEQIFEDAGKTKFGSQTDEVHSFSGIEKLYNHGNQPCLHNAWLFNYSGKPWLTQKWIRRICNEFYGTTALHGYGVGQDEDQGQLGAWYVLASLGLFDVQGHGNANPTFQFASPLFEKISIKLDTDYYAEDELVIKTKNQSPENIYIQSVKLNKAEVNNNWIERKQLLEGGEIIFELGPEPNENWGIGAPPPSMSN